MVWVTWTISLQYFPDRLLPPKWGLQKAVFETICGAVVPRATNLWIVELGAAEGSQRAGVLSSMALHYCALQSWKHRADESGGSVSPDASRDQIRRRSGMELYVGDRSEEWPPPEAKHD